MQALGGAKNHAVVLPDADMDFAADHLSAAAFGSAGERCMAISAAVVVGDAGDSLIACPGAKAEAVRVGSGRDASARWVRWSRRLPGTASPDRHRGEQAGRHAAGGRPRAPSPGFEEGFFVGPTVIDEVTTDMEVYTEEIFGPVLVVHAGDFDEAVAMVNANPYGNGTAIFTSSGEAAQNSSAGSTSG